MIAVCIGRATTTEIRWLTAHGFDVIDVNPRLVPDEWLLSLPPGERLVSICLPNHSAGEVAMAAASGQIDPPPPTYRLPRR